ncbi:HemK methyltransferase family member 1 [Anabarilius grahami]|uniref:peptide chain release factor N(5)-glutamine methyltransferase n=1 Tax=Anabarilius grahami TaxID=495550 RepID=A0A3N0YXB2_ANAGA|nr:HemK methyltransferase family member 1 [Anabarilius grahami]
MQLQPDKRSDIWVKTGSKKPEKKQLKESTPGTPALSQIRTLAFRRAAGLGERLLLLAQDLPSEVTEANTIPTYKKRFRQRRDLTLAQPYWKQALDDGHSEILTQIRTLYNMRSFVRLSSSAAEGAIAPPADCSITAEQAVRLWARHFTLHGISEPLLSSQYIISHVLGEKTLERVPRKRLRDTLTDREIERVWKLCSKRLTRMPVQYVIEEWDFSDLALKMKRPVFIPRPETEELVSLVLEDLRLIQGESQRTDLRGLEVGCGSGAIALSLLRSIPQLRVFALDQSQTAVCLTTENANRLGLQDRLDVHHLDVIKDADAILSECDPVDFIVSNPPYLLSQDMKTLQTEIFRFEDHAALDGGLDGLSVIRSILGLGSKLLKKRG